MLTTRGWWLLMASALLTLAGVVSAVSPTVAILGLTLLAWFILEWVRFDWQAGSPKLTAERIVCQDDRVVRSGWVNRPFRIQFTVSNLSRLRSPHLRIRDVSSHPLRPSNGGDLLSLEIPAHASTTSEYELLREQPGRLVFHGFHVRMSDANGFFQRDHFLEARDSVAVLPALTDDEGRQRADKRFNALPPPGTHRLRMPGSGSELLELRDYRPGDPPKMIAWKPSARRDRLITKEYESEVPVRCLLFLDSSNSVRASMTDDTMLARLCTTAAGILLAATAHRDLVGLTVFDAAGSQSHTPARSSAHVTRMLRELAEVASRVPDVPETDPNLLVRHTEPIFRTRYPKLFSSTVNSRPWGLYWRPLLDTRYGWMIFLPLLLTPWLAIQSPWLDLSVKLARAATPATTMPFLNFAVFFAVFFLTLTSPTVLALLFWLGFGLSGFQSRRRKQTRTRKQIAAILSSLDAKNAAEIEYLQYDDIAFARRIGQYLASEQIRIPLNRWGTDGTDRFREPSKLKVLSQAILRATVHARDNELYVLLIDLLDLTDDLEPLLKAAKVAHSRHHRILVILAWPKGLSIAKPGSDESLSSLNEVDRALAIGAWRRFDLIRRELTRAGATVLRLTDRETVRAVLEHLDRLRGVRSRR